MSAFIAMFLSIVLAERGDRTPLATMLFSTDGGRPKWTAFVAAAAALVLSTAIAVPLGAAAERHLSALPLKLRAGAEFIAVGAFLIAERLMKREGRHDRRAQG
jgi:putative Ca2+/H+ antiporter (TMEM165/GDT1 family)